MNAQLFEPPSNLQELLEKAGPELAALQPATLVRRAVSRDRALELTTVLLASWKPIEARLDEEFETTRAKFFKTLLEGLGERAWVFFAADLNGSEAGSDTNKEELDALAARVAEHDRILFKWATPLFGDDPIAAQNLADIARGKGRRDDAEDVLRLVNMFRSQWPEVQGQTKVDETLLDTAEADATRLIQLLKPAATNPALDLTNRAYTAWYLDYVELMEVGRFLARREPDVVARFPGVRPAAIGRPGAGQTADPPTNGEGEGDATDAVVEADGAGEPEAADQADS